MAQHQCLLEATIDFLFSKFQILESYINTFIPTSNTYSKMPTWWDCCEINFFCIGLLIDAW